MNATIFTRPGSAPMQPWFEAALTKYGWIWVGLTFGFAAKYALLIKRGIPVKARLVVADLLLLPTVALIAYQIAGRAGLEAENAALAACFCTVGADRLVKLLTERFWRQIEIATLRDMNSHVIQETGNLRQTAQTVISAQAIVDRQRESNLDD